MSKEDRDGGKAREDAWGAWFAGLGSALKLRADPTTPERRPTFVAIPQPRRPAPVVSIWPDYSAGYYGLEWWRR